MRYIIHPGYVRSKNDGDLHYITAEQLIRLYRVNRRDCIIVDDKRRLPGMQKQPGDVHLYPRRDGDYELE